MPRKPHAANCMVNSLSTNLTAHHRGLWITDALLAETFHKFCHSPRRYGSNVPGPLEARRRASKRKNTSLAYGGDGAGLPVYDPAVMLGKGSRDRWWKKVEVGPAGAAGRQRVAGPKKEIENRASSILPSWLFKMPSTKPQVPDTLRDDVQHGERPIEFEDVTANTAMEYRFKARIAQAIDLKSVQYAIKHTRLSLRQRPDLSEFAFHHLLELYGRTGNFARLAEALYDPALHPPGSRNHLVFIQHLCSRQNTRKLWDSGTFPALLKAIELGLVPTDDLQEIILLIPEVHKSMPMLRVSNKAHAEWHRLLSAIEQSRVLRLDDLDSDFLTSWYQQIATAVQTDTTCLLLWRLRRYSGLSDLEVASELTVRRLNDFVEINQGASEKLIDWLTSLPSDLQGPVMIQTTFRMLAAAQLEQPLERNALDIWSTLLPQLNSEKVHNFPINRSAWSEASVIPCELTPPQQLLTVIWIVTRIWALRPNDTSRFANTELRDEFAIAFHNMQHVDEYDHLSRIILTLDTLPLPEREQIFPFLQHFSKQRLVKMLGNVMYADGLKAYCRLEYAQLHDNDFALKVKHDFPQALTTLAESTNMDLYQFTAMAQTLILKNSENFRIVRRLLNHNMELRFALTQSWPSTTSKRNAQSIESSNLDPAAVLSMIERLIMTFAVTPAISPRSAFRHVYKMYLFLHKIGAPTNPVIGRALWHSGVTRYGQVGAPKNQVIWCMAKVRELEGEEAANRLLWSAGFRKTFVQDFIHLLGSSPFPKKLPEELRADEAGNGMAQQENRTVLLEEDVPRTAPEEN